MGHAARRLAQTRFHVDDAVDAYQAVYEGAIR
jgi:hypothetical protein